MKRPVRIANCSGFFGDRLAAAQEMVDGGPIDVLTGDWLAELTMLLLARQKMKHGTGYARTFQQQMEQVLPTCLEKGIKVVSNAGGLDPVAAAQAIREMGTGAKVASVSGDDLLPRFAEVGGDWTNLDTGEPFTGHPLSANAYLGARGIVAALDAGADVVVTGRVTDAALVIGPAAWWHGWDLDSVGQPRRAGRCPGRRARHRMRRTGLGRQLRLLPGGARPRARGLPDRRAGQRWHQRDHEAPGHRRASEPRHGDRPTALRGGRRALPEPRRDGTVRHHRDRSGRQGPGASFRCARGGRPGDAEGRDQLPRWLPQLDDAGPDRCGHRGEGRHRRADDLRGGAGGGEGALPVRTRRALQARRAGTHRRVPAACQ